MTPMTLRQRLEDALTEVLERYRLGVSFLSACEDVCGAYGLSADEIEEYAAEQAAGEREIAAWEGVGR